MYYEINVSELDVNPYRTGAKPHYTHLFATHARSLTQRVDMLKVYAKLKKAFPHPQYCVSVSYWENKGEQLSIPELDLEVKQRRL